MAAAATAAIIKGEPKSSCWLFMACGAHLSGAVLLRMLSYRQAVFKAARQGQCLTARPELRASLASSTYPGNQSATTVRAEAPIFIT
jgi:hypothetical protein